MFAGANQKLHIKISEFFVDKLIAIMPFKASKIISYP
jgi:hypothetical protein